MMQYPLQEKIGLPELLVGRAREFANFPQWLANMPRKLSKSRAILARRKSGKTVFIQRLFNELWNTNGQVIPFYFEFAENKIWLPELAIKYYCAFVSQYISFRLFMGFKDLTPIAAEAPVAVIAIFGIATCNPY